MIAIITVNIINITELLNSKYNILQLWYFWWISCRISYRIANFLFVTNYHSNRFTRRLSIGTIHENFRETMFGVEQIPRQLHHVPCSDILATIKKNIRQFNSTEKLRKSDSFSREKLISRPGRAIYRPMIFTGKIDNDSSPAADNQPDWN